MTPLATCPSYVLNLLGIVFMVLSVPAIVLVVETTFARSSLYVVVAGGVLATASAVLASAVSGVLAWSVGDDATLGGVVARALAYSPLWLCGALILLLAVGEALLARHLGAVRTASVSADSVKEALDTLPDGALFSEADGRPILKNLQAEKLGLSPDVTEGVLGDGAGRAWQVSHATILVGETEVAETIATDVTEQYTLVRELERRAERSREVNARLRAYGRDLVRLTREEEILAMKTRVHGETGRALVALRAYEAQDPSRRDRAALVELWNRTLRLLRGAEADEDESSADEWSQLAEVAGAIGVRLTLGGELPGEGDARGVVLAVVHECLNNAVRHGGAHEVHVTCSVGGGVVGLRVTNDGSAPAAPAEEHGGLANIRAMVERAGGTLKVEWSPQVVVMASFEAGAA